VLITNLLKERPKTRLVIIDPVSAFLGSTDSHNNAQMRGLLAPLSALATDNGIAIVCVTHLNKGSGTNAMHRITGSLALVAAARASYLVTKDPDDPKRRFMLPMKNNLGDDQHGFAYSIAVDENGAPYVLWENEPVQVSADDALNNVEETVDDITARDEAKEWLLTQLENGAVPSNKMLSKAKKDGIAIKTLRRAKTDLKVGSIRKDGHWS
jgi:RecA-family ATPase